MTTLSGCGARPEPTQNRVEGGGVVVASAPSGPSASRPVEPEPLPTPTVASAEPIPDVAEPGEEPPPARLFKGSVAPPFDLPRVGNPGRVALGKQKGKVVILHFFATWAEPSRKALARFADIAKEIGSNNVVVVAVSVDDPDAAGALRTYVKDLSQSTLVVHDTTGAVAQAYGPPTMPATYMIDREGVTQLLQAGFSDDAVAPLRAEVAALVQKH